MAAMWALLLLPFLTAASPTAAPTGCPSTDVCTDQAGWQTAADGYHCADGYQTAQDCITYADQVDVNGVGPEAACCVCGGGTCAAAGPASGTTQVVQEMTQSIPG